MLIMNDDTIIELAICNKKKNRYRELLAKPKKRNKILDELNHNPALNEKFTRWFNSIDDALKTVSVESEQPVYLLSETKEIDGKTIPFSEAIEIMQLNGWGTIILVTPNLAIYYGENGERAAIISKPVK